MSRRKKRYGHKKKRGHENSLPAEDRPFFFGRRFYGHKLRTVSSWYLQWMLENVTDDRWRDVATNELHRRGEPLTKKSPEVPASEPIVAPALTCEERAIRLREIAQRVSGRQRTLFDADDRPTPKPPVLSSVPIRIAVVNPGNGAECPF